MSSSRSKSDKSDDDDADSDCTRDEVDVRRLGAGEDLDEDGSRRVLTSVFKLDLGDLWCECEENRRGLKLEDDGPVDGIRFGWDLEKEGTARVEPFDLGIGRLTATLEMIGPDEVVGLSPCA